MPNITLQLYKTGTLTALVGISVAIWNTGDTTVIASGVTDANGQLTKSLSAATDYNIRGFADGYSITDTSITTGVADETFNVYGNAVPYGAKTYEDYKDEIVANLRGRNDTTTLALILSNFNIVQEYISLDMETEDLTTYVGGSLVTSTDEYSFSTLGMSALNEVIAIRIYDGISWGIPLSWIAPNDWDIYIETVVDTSAEGKPLYFTRRNKKIIVYPVPDDSYTYLIVATLYATSVTGNDSVVDFSKKDGLLIKLTTGFTWQSLGERELAADAFAQVDRLLAAYGQTEIRKRYAASQAYKNLNPYK